MTGDEQPSVLVLAIGNPDRGDDGFGPAVAQRLPGPVHPTVRILERSGDALALIEDWEGIPSVIVIDAMAPISEPGQVHRFDLTDSPLPIGFAPSSSHAFGVAETVELARSLGRLPRYLVAYLVEGEQFGTGAPLSLAVAQAVGDVAEHVVNEVLTILKAKGKVDMHETALVRDVVRRIEDLARASGARRVMGAKVWLGALSHLSADHFREHYAIEAQGSIAAEATLAIEVSDDLNHTHAQHVRLESVDLDE
jgi:hydrogenase maturation protease